MPPSSDNPPPAEQVSAYLEHIADVRRRLLETAAQLALNGATAHLEAAARDLEPPARRSRDQDR